MNKYLWILTVSLALGALMCIGQTDTVAELELTAAGIITVSGTVTGPGGPVPDVWVGVGSPQDWQETWTNANGFYSVSIQTEGELWFNIRPDVATRLTQVNLWIDGVTAGLTQNFTVTNGYLLSIRPTGSGGTPITQELWFDVQPLQNMLPDDRWYQLDWDESTQRYQAVLPPDVYYVTVQNPPAEYHRTTQVFDLRTADLSADMPLSTVYVHPIPYGFQDHHRPAR